MKRIRDDVLEEQGHSFPEFPDLIVEDQEAEDAWQQFEEEEL